MKKRYQSVIVVPRLEDPESVSIDELDDHNLLLEEVFQQLEMERTRTLGVFETPGWSPGVRVSVHGGLSERSGGDQRWPGPASGVDGADGSKIPGDVCFVETPGYLIGAGGTVVPDRRTATRQISRR